MSSGNTSVRLKSAKPDRAAVDQTGDGRESDDSLLTLIGRGDAKSTHQSWAILVDRHLPPITRYASYVLRDAARAEDLAQ